MRAALSSTRSPTFRTTRWLPGLALGQPIRTHTIGFDPDGDSAALMSAMAFRGEGLSFEATGYEQLDAAFETIIANSVPRGQVSFNPGAVQNDGLFSGNFLYAPTFRPVANGYWFGTIKKHCILPTSPTDDECLFEDQAGELVTNDRPVDQWTTIRSNLATRR